MLICTWRWCCCRQPLGHYGGCHKQHYCLQCSSPNRHAGTFSPSLQSGFEMTLRFLIQTSEKFEIGLLAVHLRTCVRFSKNARLSLREAFQLLSQTPCQRDHWFLCQSVWQIRGCLSPHAHLSPRFTAIRVQGYDRVAEHEPPTVFAKKNAAAQIRHLKKKV